MHYCTLSPDSVHLATTTMDAVKPNPVVPWTENAASSRWNDVERRHEIRRLLRAAVEQNLAVRRMALAHEESWTAAALADRNDTSRAVVATEQTCTLLLRPTTLWEVSRLRRQQQRRILQQIEREQQTLLDPRRGAWNNASPDGEESSLSDQE